MNEITRIHLAATPYNIEVSAKKELEKYLAAIVKVFGADEDAQREIEARMVELLIERGVTGEKVVTTADVKALQEALGAPGDFAEAGTPVVADAPKKRLMRDTEHGMVGGVLSGMAAYTGVDVVWWRIATVVLALASFGTILLLYVVLWVVVPRAQTATERLQMRGVEPTLENIQGEAAREVREEVPTKQKPLVIILRIMGILSLFGAGLAACLVIGVVIFYVASAWAGDAWLMNPWLVGATVSGVLSGVLFVVLMLLGIYALTAWRLTRVVSMVALAIIVLGLVSFGTAIATVTYGAGVAQRSIEAHTTTQRVELDSQLAGVKQVSLRDLGPRVIYVVDEGRPYAEIRSVDKPGAQKVQLVVDRQGDTASLRLAHLQRHASCDWGCTRDDVAVTIHGPALEHVRLDAANLSYERANQDILEVETNGDASFTLNGKVRELHAKTGENSQVSSSDAAVDRAVLELAGNNSRVELGVVQQLALTAPKSCSFATERTVNYARADAIMLNGTPVTMTEDIPCLALHHEEADAR